MRQTIWRKGSFASCHRISNHCGKCKNLHGHNYNYELGITYNLNNTELNECNYVIDFGDIKQRYIEMIDKFFDHSVIANEQDTKVIELAKEINDVTRVIPTIGDPSVEVISQLILYLCAKVSEKYNKPGSDIFVNKIRIYETDNSCCDLSVSKEDIKNIKVSDYFENLIKYNV